MMSPGRKALPETAFSTAGISKCSRTGSRSEATSWAKASACAAPPMSFFMSRIPVAGLMSRPPLSKQTPLPTTATRGCAGLPHSTSIIRAARSGDAACPTAATSG
jgi:hypothetical protein